MRRKINDSLSIGPGLNTTFNSQLDRTFFSVGDIIEKGDVIGQLGSTGRSTGPHLNYSVFYDNNWIPDIEEIRNKIILTSLNPLWFLPNSVKEE
ncbi:MAG: M23 family metallopeptidase [Spirochaetales bacterium]|nr:M23 family metallopeptidase [Spirochaetales bacterium]